MRKFSGMEVSSKSMVHLWIWIYFAQSLQSILTSFPPWFPARAINNLAQHRIGAISLTVIEMYCTIIYTNVLWRAKCLTSIVLLDLIGMKETNKRIGRSTRLIIENVKRYFSTSPY